MKRRFRVAAAIGAFALLSSAGISVSAQNSVAVQKVEILDTNGEVTNSYTTTDNIILTPSDLMQVTIALNDEAKAAVNEGAVTFLSYVKDGEAALSNDNIQYIDQKTSNDTGTVTIKFRPRPSVGVGEFAARIGGVNVTEAGSFLYTVAEAEKLMTLTPVDGTASVEQGSGANASFTLTPVPTAAITVAIDGTVLQEGGYTYENGTLAILNAGSYAVGEHIVTVSAEGYKNAEAKFKVTEQEVNISEEEAKAIEKYLSEYVVAAPTGEARSVTLPESVTVDNEKTFPVSYALAGENANVTLNGNTITLKNDVFAAKADIVATVGKTITVSRRVYIVPENAKIAFGNIGLFTDSEGGDAFAKDPSFEAVLTPDNKPEFDAEKVRALSLALRKATKETAGSDLPIFDALDYDRNGTITLAEYRVFKMMLTGDAGFAPSKIAAQRGAAE